MKKFNRVLAMLLALVTVLAILPISALADNWLSVEADKTTVENVTSTDITVSVDPKALLSYIKDGDVKGLLKGISASGSLSDILTKKEILALLPEEEIIALVKAIIADIDVRELVGCFDADELLACVDKDGLISLLKGMDLKSYVKDGAFDTLMKYISDKDIEKAVDYLDTDALIEKYSTELMKLALDLNQTTLLSLVNIDKAIKLNGVKFEDALNLDFFKSTVGYANLAENYVNDSALEDYFTNNEAYFEDILPDYLDEVTETVDVAGMINDGKLAIRDLIVANVILVDALVAKYGYANLADVATVINKVVAGLNGGTILPTAVLDCLKVEYSVAVDAIVNEKGVDAIVAAIPGGYETLIDYVDVKNYIRVLDVKGIAKKFISNREITNIIDVNGLVRAIDVRAFVSKVDYKQLIKVVYESGVAQKLLEQLDIKSYLIRAFGIYNSIATTVTELKLNGVVVASPNPSTDVLQLDAARLLDALENLVPSLNELANIGSDGKIFSASLAISYYESEADDAEILTKEINFNFVLESGVDLIRRTAAKLAVLLDKIGYIGLADGKLIAEINVPSEFATVLRVALEKMADSSNPAVNALKDKVLAVYSQQPNDFIAFAEGLTLEEVVAVLEAVDPALFGKAYNKVLTSRYAKVLLSYIERVTGYDFSDNLEAQNLINTLATIPTFEYFVEKLENVTGVEITDRLPAKVNGYFDHTVYDVIDKLANVAGYDFDLQNLLKSAAASTDPFAYLYTAVVNKVENADAIYNFVQRNAIRVANRLLATRFGAVIADNSLKDFYAGNSAFVFEKTVTFDAKVVLEKAFKKVLGVVAARVDAIDNRKDAINEVIDTALDMVLGNSAYMTTGFDITVNVRNLYRATFVNEDGKVIITTFLPVGTNLSKMVENYNGNADFEGWLNVATGAFIDYMPAKDVTVKATLKGEEIITPEVTDPEETTPTEPEVTDPEVTTPTEPEVTDPDEPQPEEPDVVIGDLVYGEDYVVVDNAGEDYQVVLLKDWDSWNDGLRFAFSGDLLRDLIANARNLVVTSQVTFHKAIMNVAMLEQLVADAAIRNSEVVGFNYKSGADLFFNFNNKSGAAAFDFAFDFGTTPEVNYTFNGNASVVITVPFAGVVENAGQKTFVYADGTEVAESEANAESVTFTAKHFSNYTVVNKYLLTIENGCFYVNGNANPINSAIAAITTTGNAQLSGIYYEEGYEISASLQVNNVDGYKYLNTVFEGSTTVLNAAGDFTFEMPANAVTVKHYAEVVTKYFVYYYVNGTCVGSYEYTLDVNSDKDAIANEILNNSNITLPAEVTGAGWSWFDNENLANRLGGDPINLFRVHEEQTTITFKFTGVDSLNPVYKINELNQNVFADLASKIDAIQPGYVWSTALTGKALTYYVENADYTALIEAALANGNVVEFAGARANQNYHIYTDGNVTVEDITVGMKVTAAAKEGFTAKIQIFNHNNGTLISEFEGNEYTFVMPTNDVYICVVYTANTVNYKEVTITVPAGSVLTADPLTIADAELVGLALVKAERGTDGSLKLTYRYALVEGFDATAFEASINALVGAAQYATTWIVNGVAYDSELAASQATLPEGAKIVGWTEMSQNVKLAVIEYTAPAGVSAWLIVCIILVVLLLIALIALIYVLHVTDKIAASWLTKVCAAIVGAFFAFCMILAKFALKVLNFMGIKTEDILEELPEEEPVEDIPAVIIDNEEAAEETAEEATEEVAEEATEEVVEEATEEVAEEATEEVAEEATEEAAEEATEEVAEEATEEVAEEATEEVAEEATEEAAEEATEEVAEEATEEVAEEATEEVAEEATEEVAEEATEEVVEEVAEEATEEVAEEATEEVVEEATEEVAEEATEEVVEEATEETAEEATEEVVEEAIEEAPVEEVAVEETVEEATEETSEEEKKDE